MFKEMKLGHLKVNEDNLKLVLFGGRKAMKKLLEGVGNRTLTLVPLPAEPPLCKFGKP